MTKTKTVVAKPQHTPGPWTDNGAGMIHPVGEFTLRDVVARTELANGASDANARLIAAAPALLAALKDCCGWFQGDSRNGVAIKARAAIARAESR